MLIWLLADSDTGKFAAFKNLLHSFCAHYPDIKADFRVLTRRSMWQNLFAHLRDSKNRESADVMELPHSWTAVFAKLGLLAELGGVLETFNPARYPDFLKPGCVSESNDAVFSAPWWMEAPALFYRPEEFRKHALRPETGLADWESFLSVCERLAAANKKRGFYPVLQSAGSGLLNSFNALPCVRNRGGALFSEDKNRCTLSKDEVVRGLEDYLEPALRGYMPLFGEAVFEGGPFYEEAAAMVLGSRAPASPGRKSVFKPARVPGSRKKDPAFSYNLAAASGSQHLKEAGLFLKWALSADNTRSFAAAFGVFPCLKQVFEETLNDGAEARRELFSAPELTPNTTVYPTAELLLDRALWHASLRIVRQSYAREDFLRELILAQGEIDYLLSLY
ncbi:MAG: extracellular solute-binding protein [Elusimicrobiales bacterium]|jgi:ABC-type glycerol-3-phosphate transport system substrate-binding protein